MDRISLAIESKQCLAIVGHNGSGKSTLLKLIAGLVKASSGQIILKPYTKIGYAPEHFPKLRFSAEEYLYAMGRIQHMPKPILNNRIKELLGRFSLQETYPITNFSKGMAQKVNLMQAVLGKPNVLILDEPLSGLDAASQEELARMLQTFKNEGITIIMTCHESNLLDQLADRIVTIRNGRIQSDHSNYVHIEEAVYHIVYALPAGIGGVPSFVMSLMSSGSIVKYEDGNEIFVKEEFRDIILLELLKQKCSILSVHCMDRLHTRKGGSE
ncbi:ABC transporter ATP-binding protein [Paenibacillus sp. PL2-23]|uniref:ABC transporter ATP-binding protein n=1 Tax=Paenibacillus sp. PL2-23 TaxID=2100729 RepID=UPI0030FB3CAA